MRYKSKHNNMCACVYVYLCEWYTLSHIDFFLIDYTHKISTNNHSRTWWCSDNVKDEKSGSQSKAGSNPAATKYPYQTNPVWFK